MSLVEFAATFTLRRSTAEDAADLDHQPEVTEESAPETHKTGTNYIGEWIGSNVLHY